MILVSQQINAYFPSEPHLDKQVEIYLEIYPILKSSLLLAHLAKQGYMAQKESIHTINAHDIVRVGQLIDKINRNYPADSFSPITLFALLSNNILDPDEIDILKNALPTYNGTTNTRVTANINGNISITFSNAMKHSGMFYTVSFIGNYGLSFPITMTLTTYTDMDNLKNHQEFDGDSGCPFRNQFWICSKCNKENSGIDPVSCNDDDKLTCSHCKKSFKYVNVDTYPVPDDCDCEAHVAFNGELVINDPFKPNDVLQWIESHLFLNQ